MWRSLFEKRSNISGYPFKLERELHPHSSVRGMQVRILTATPGRIVWGVHHEPDKITNKTASWKKSFNRRGFEKLTR